MNPILKGKLVPHCASDLLFVVHVIVGLEELQVDNFDAEYDYVANDGSLFTFRTNLKASRYRLVRVDLSKAGPPETWADVVPEGPDLLAGAVALQVGSCDNFLRQISF